MQMSSQRVRVLFRVLLFFACTPAYLGVPGGDLAAANVLAVVTVFLFALTFVDRLECLLPHFVWGVFWWASVLFVGADRDYERFRADDYELRYNELVKEYKSRP